MEQLQVILGAFTTLLAWEPARATFWLCHLQIKWPWPP